MQVSFEFDVNSFRTLYEDLTPLRFSRAINKAARELAGEAIDRFEMTVEGWRTPVEFFSDFVLKPSQDEVSFGIYTNSDLYIMVDAGTKPHVIKPKKAKALRIPKSYFAATQPGVLSSGEALYSDEFIFVNEFVTHGSKGRGFSDKVYEEISDIAIDEIIAQLDLAWARQQRG